MQVRFRAQPEKEDEDDKVLNVVGIGFLVYLAVYCVEVKMSTGLEDQDGVDDDRDPDALINCFSPRNAVVCIVVCGSNRNCAQPDRMWIMLLSPRC